MLNTLFTRKTKYYIIILRKKWREIEKKETIYLGIWTHTKKELNNYCNVLTTKKYRSQYEKIKIDANKNIGDRPYKLEPEKSR